MSDEQDELRARVSSEKDWRAIAQMVSDLPPLPHIAMQAMKLVENPNVTANQITELISQDTALAARLLKISNSAMFARRAKISTVSQAILMVGLKTLKGIILAATLRGMSRQESQLENMIWQNSLCTAFCANFITKQLRYKFHEETFTLGLLHDLGKIALLTQIPREYALTVRETVKGFTFTEAEQDRLGYSHALVGAMVAKKWNFPQDICQVILHHHDPLDLPYTDEVIIRTAIVQTADLMAHAIGIGHPEGYPCQKEEAIKSMQRLGIPQDDTEKHLVECKELFSEQISHGD